MVRGIEKDVGVVFAEVEGNTFRHRISSPESILLEVWCLVETLSEDTRLHLRHY